MKRIDLDRALMFIDEHGNLQDKARLLYLMMGETPPASVMQPLLGKQNADGGFPSRPQGIRPSSVDSTITALWQMNEVGMLNGQEACRAMDFLIQFQRADGSWDENEALPEDDLPPWIVPGQLASVNYLTAYSAYWLAISEYPKGRPALEKAINFLMAQQQENGEFQGYLHSQWIATGALLKYGQYPQRVDRSLQYIQARPVDKWDDTQLNWALDCLAAGGLPADHPLVQFLLDKLSNQQDDNGSWSSEEGPAYAVSATIGALKAIKMFGGIDITL